MTMIEKITLACEAAMDKGLTFGLRVVNTKRGDESYSEGDNLPCSYEWEGDLREFGESTGQELTGTCALVISHDGWDCDDTEDEILDRLSPYLNVVGTQVLVIAGENPYEGMDENEIILENAEVVADISEYFA